MTQDTRNEQAAVSEAADWLVRVEGNASESERVAFIEWVSQDPEHVRQILELYALRVEARRVVRSDPALIRRMHACHSIARFRPVQHREQPTSPSVSLVALSKPSATRFWTIVASFVGFVALMLFAKGEMTPVYQTSAGQNRLIVLADGSRLHLRSSTKVRVRLGPITRDIFLQRGEAFFDVAHDPFHPFRVHARDAVSEALGTQFGIRMQDTELSISVKQGRVALAAGGGSKDSIVIESGQQATRSLQSNPRQWQLSLLSMQRRREAFAWTGTIDLTGMTLRDVVARFNKSNVTQIAIDDPAIRDIRLGGRVWLLEPEQFVRSLQRMDIAWDARESGFTKTYHLSRFSSGLDGSAVKRPAQSVR